METRFLQMAIVTLGLIFAFVSCSPPPAPTDERSQSKAATPSFPDKPEVGISFEELRNEVKPFPSFVDGTRAHQIDIYLDKKIFTEANVLRILAGYRKIYAESSQVLYIVFYADRERFAAALKLEAEGMKTEPTLLPVPTGPAERKRFDVAKTQDAIYWRYHVLTETGLRVVEGCRYYMDPQKPYVGRVVELPIPSRSL